MNGMFRKETADGFELTVAFTGLHGPAGGLYPVVYVQDAGRVALDGWNCLQHLTVTGRLPELFVVGIRPHDRNDDYTPWPAPALVAGMPGFGGGADRYLDTLVHRIKPFVDASCPTRPDPAHTAIAGCSLGGLLAAYASFRHPGVFGKYALLSASFWYDGFLDFMRGEPVTRRDRTWQARPVDRSAHRLYMYAGELEGVYKRTAQRYMVARTKEARAVLLAQGMPPEQLKPETDANGTHDAFFFTGRFMNALQWLFAERGAADA